MDLDGVVTLEMDERISMKKINRQTFRLIIQQVKSTDSGSYRCSVKEWIQDPDGLWYSLNTKSVTTQLDVFEKGILPCVLLDHTTDHKCYHIYTTEKSYKLIY